MRASDELPWGKLGHPTPYSFIFALRQHLVCLVRCIDDDTRVWNLWKGGWQTLFEEIYERHRASVERFALSLTRDAARAEDLVQETFVRALGHLPLLATMDEGHRRGWLFTVLRNLKRDQDRRGRFETSMGSFSYPEPHAEVSNEVEWADLLDRLPATLRAIVIQRYWHGLNSREIASRVGIADATVRSQLRKAMKLLRTDLGDTGH